MNPIRTTRIENTRNEIISRLDPLHTVLVCGLGITGIETALWLRRESRAVVCVERSTRSAYETKDKFHRLSELEAAGVKLYFGIDGEEVLTAIAALSVGIAVLSPGISLASALVGSLRHARVPCVTELELGVLLAGVRTIMVTGSNGKSTTVSLIDHLLKAAGQRSLLCGNVGKPVVAEFRAGELESGLGARFDWLVVEASSYQLEGCESLAPDIGVLLNLSDNHLERHGSMERYRDVKLSMVLRQNTAQTVVVNRDDRWFGGVPGGVMARLPGRLVTFGNSALAPDAIGAQVRDHELMVRSSAAREQLFDLQGTKLLGAHNRLNIAAAVTAVAAAGVEISGLSRAEHDFSPLEHRLEFVTTLAGARILNDSKSTTVAATVAALQATMEDLRAAGGRLVLCVGGVAKAGSWQPLIEELQRVRPLVKGVICFGKDGPLIADHILARIELHVTIEPTVGAAVQRGCDLLKQHDLMLFSPGCASFDEFTDFEHRGKEFKKAIKMHAGTDKSLISLCNRE